MIVIRADKLGFCFGVEDAIELAQTAATHQPKLYSLGPLIHNEQVIQHLSQEGLQPVDSFDELDGAPVVIRAHGVPPDTMEEVRKRTSNVIDATCVLVRRAQQAVSALHRDGYAVVIVGDANHPEVKGIIGYAPNVTVVPNVDEVARVPQNGRIGVVGQTTLPQERFADVVRALSMRPFREIKVVNTLCLEVLHRQQSALELCRKVDVVFVLGGRNSANTRELAELCRSTGVPTFHVEDWSDFRDEHVQGCKTAGLTAGASTPGWIIERFARELEAYDEDS